MAFPVQTGPDEETTPLLGGDGASKTVRIYESHPKAVALADHCTNEGVTTNGVPEVVKETPFPWTQVSIIMFLQLAEPMTSLVISPFAPELIRGLNVVETEAEVGYYVGILQSLFFITEACTVWHWSRLSDHIGRKPVVLTGLFGLSLSMYCFGLSKSFWGLVFSRALNGALNGNVGVFKSILVEMTGPTGLAVAYSYQSLAWATGVTVGPVVGGALSRPAERFPSLFGNNEFLKEYPYFLPCSAAATFTLVAWLVTFFFLKETHPSPKPIMRFLCGAKQPIAPEEEALLTPEAQPRDEPVPLRELVTRDVLVASMSYAYVALLDISFRVLQPVFLSTPIELGGLGLDPPAIGTIISLLGILDGILNVIIFARLVDWFGAKKVYLVGMAAAVPCFSFFPLINYLVRNSVDRSGGLGTKVWIAVGAQAVLSVLTYLCYGTAFIFIAAAAPNRASLGATNGFAQLLVSILRAIGPALVTSMYSLSIDREHHYMNGGLVYYVTVVLSFGGIWVGLLLPKSPFGK